MFWKLMLCKLYIGNSLIWYISMVLEVKINNRAQPLICNCYLFFIYNNYTQIKTEMFVLGMHKMKIVGCNLNQKPIYQSVWGEQSTEREVHI